MKKKIYVTTTFRNCMNNNYLTAQIRSFLGLNDYDLVGSAAESDYIVVTTCGFDQPREDEATAIVRRFSEEFPDKRVVVSGCLPGIAPSFSHGFNNVIQINTNKLQEFDGLFEAKRGIGTVKAHVFDDLAVAGPEGLFNIEISKGCTNRCTYCIIWKAKGRLTSKPIEEIAAEIEDGLKQGYDQFCLLSDNCSIYGFDIGTDLAALLNRVDEINGDFKIFLYYAEPNRFVSLFPKIKKSAFARVCYLDLPAQSGSGDVLANMKRNYTPDMVEKLVRQIKGEFPDVVLATHFLVGFPGETMDDFWESLALSSHFDRVTFFIYTDRAGTLAETFTDKVSRRELEQRTEIIRQFIQGNPRMQLQQ